MFLKSTCILHEKKLFLFFFSLIKLKVMHEQSHEDPILLHMLKVKKKTNKKVEAKWNLIYKIENM